MIFYAQTFAGPRGRCWKPEPERWGFQLLPRGPANINVSENEPRHDKTNNVAVRPAKTQISLGICPVWSVFAVRMKRPCVLSYPLSAQRRLWSDWADAQADLSLRWAHTHFVGFVMLRLRLCVIAIIAHTHTHRVVQENSNTLKKLHL